MAPLSANSITNPNLRKPTPIGALSILMTLGLHALGAVDHDAGSVIRLGMSTVLSGPAAELGREMQLGVQTGLDRENRAGGVHGLKLRLETLDDGYEPSRTAPNMRQLIENDQVLAIIGCI